MNSGVGQQWFRYAQENLGWTRNIHDHAEMEWLPPIQTELLAERYLLEHLARLVQESLAPNMPQGNENGMEVDIQHDDSNKMELELVHRIVTFLNGILRNCLSANTQPPFTEHSMEIDFQHDDSNRMEVEM